MTTRTNRIWKVLASCAVLAMLAAACSGSDPGDGGDGGDSPATTADQTAAPSTVAQGDGPSEPETGEIQRGGEITVGVVSETNSWYPPESEPAFSAGQVVGATFFETLFLRTGSGEILPHLAAEPMVPNADASEWTVTLRPGITFHDGTQLDADALVEMSALWDTGRFATPGEGIDQTIKVDDLTVTYTLFEPDPAFGDTLAGTRGIAFSPTAVNAFGPEDSADRPVGTGPFIFQEWRRDSELVVTRNPNYWQEGQPYLDRITFRVLQDMDSRNASVAAGDLDMSTQGGADGQQDLIDQGFVAYEFLGNGAGVMIYNTLEPPTDDVRVRRGLSSARNPESTAAITTSNLSGVNEIRHGYFSSSSSWYSEEAGAGYAFYDVEAARADFDSYVNDPNRSDGKAVGEPISFTYECNSEPQNLLLAQLFQQEWGDLGVEVDIATHEQSTFVTKVIGSPADDPAFKGDFNATCWADGTAGDPLSIFDSRYGAVAQNVLNWTNYTNPLIDEQLDILRGTTDFDARYAAAAEITRITAEDMPIWWGATGATVVISKDTVKNVEGYTHPDGTPGTRRPAGQIWFHEIWLEGAEPIDIPLDLVEIPDTPATTTTTEPAVVLPGPDAAIEALLPDGSAISPGFIDQAVGTPPADQCPDWSNHEGLSPISITARSFSGATGFDPAGSMVIYEFPNADEANALLDSYLDGAAGPCAEYDTVVNGNPLHYTWAEGDNSPSLGERTLTMFGRGDSAGFPVNSDTVMIVVGNYVGYYGVLNLGTFPNVEERDIAAEILEGILLGL